MTIIAIANQKGGTGKTTTAINLGAALGDLGRRVLVVDLDPQANATLHAGLKPEAQEVTIWSAMQQTLEKPKIGKEDLRDLLNSLWEGQDFDPALIPILHQPNNNPFDLVPSNLDLSEADLNLTSAVSRERCLSRVLASLHNYDYILIDCPPHLGILTINALTAAESVIIPLESAFFASKGMNQLFRVILQIKQTLNHRLRVLGVLITRVDQRTVHSRQIAAEAREALKERVRVFETKVPINVDLSDASAAGVSILHYAPKSRGAQAYQQLAVEVERIQYGEKD